MRLTMKDAVGENGIEMLKLCQNYKILLDGKDQHESRIYCIEADEEEGYVIAFSRDENGRLITKDGYTKMERLEGKVEIINLRKL